MKKTIHKWKMKKINTWKIETFFFLKKNKKIKKKQRKNINK